MSKTNQGMETSRGDYLCTQSKDEAFWKLLLYNESLQPAALVNNSELNLIKNKMK